MRARYDLRRFSLTPICAVLIALSNALPVLLAWHVCSVPMSADSSSTIQSPYLVIRYGQREKSTIYAQGSGAQAKLTFSMEYTKDLDNQWKAAQGLFGTAIVLAVIQCGRRVWLWHSKSQGDVPELNVMVTASCLCI